MSFIGGFIQRVWGEWSANIKAVFILIALSFIVSTTITTFGDATGNITISNFGVHVSTVCKLLAIAFIFAEGEKKHTLLHAISGLLFGLTLVYAIVAIAHLFGLFPSLMVTATEIARSGWTTIGAIVIIYLVTAYLNNVFSSKSDTEVQDDHFNQS